jgi:hypothetical protein
MRVNLTFKLLIGLVLCLLGLAEGGCRRADAPPAPLPVEQAPAELRQAFAKAVDPANTLAAQLTAALQGHDYPAAFEALQSLNALPGLSQPQRLVLARTTLTLAPLLRTAQAQGDAKADAALKAYYMNR